MDGDLQDGDVDKIDGDLVDGDKPDGDQDTDNDPDNDIVEDGDLEPDADVDSDSDGDSDLDMPCISCDASTETGCFMDKVAGTCSMTRCEDGCLIEEKTPEGRYGYCDPLPGRGCVFCDTRNAFGAFLDCDPLYPDGPPDDLPEGAGIIDDGSLMRGYLTENPPWQDRLNPGEIRLSEYWGADANIYVDAGDEYIIWNNWSYAFLLVYHVKTGFLQELKPEEIKWIMISSVDGKKVYTQATFMDEETQAMYVVDPLTRYYKRLPEPAVWGYNFIYHVHANDGLFVVTDSRGLFLFFPDTEEFRKMQTPRYFENGHVFGNYVTWDTNAPSNAILYSILTEEQSIISISDEVEQETENMVNGDRDYVVWFASWYDSEAPEDVSSANTLYRISTGERRRLESNGLITAARIDEDVVVWAERNSEGQFRIRLYDITTDSYHWVTNTDKGGSQLAPSKKGRWLAYIEQSRFSDYTEQEGHYGETVMLYDLCTMELFKNREMCAE